MLREALIAVIWTTLLLLPVRGASSGEVDSASRSAIQIDQQKGLAQPQVAIDAKGVIHVVYGRAETVYYAASADGGRHFSKPVEAFDCRNMSLGMRRGPRLAISGETAVVTAIGGEQGKGRDGDVQAWHREADGKWSGPVQVNDVTGAAREGLHGMAAGSDGTVWCVWLDLREPGTKVYAARSVDGGRTWGRNILVYRSPEKSVCECCHPSVVVGPGKRVTVLFRNSVGGKRDMYVASSSDGETFSSAAPVSSRTWKLAACPMDGGMVALTSKGDGWTIYRRDKQVFLTPLADAGSRRQDAGENLLGAGDQPTVAALATGPLSVWTNSDDLMMKGPGDESPRRVATGARFASVASDPAGELAAIVWEEKTRDQPGTIIRLNVVPAATR